MRVYRFNESAFSIHGLLTKAECDEWIKRAENSGFEDAPISTSLGDQVQKNVRNNARVILDDKEWAEKIWMRMSEIQFPGFESWEPSNLNERFRIYRYQKYQEFRSHSDGKFHLSEMEESKLTFIIYLNDEYQGGSTNFDDFVAWPETGMGLCFDHSLRHEGSMVLDGVKYALRSDIMYKAVV